MSNYDRLFALGIKMKRPTGSFKSTCPKCSESRKDKNDPCLSVNVTEGIYNCHNCGFHGNVFVNGPKKEYVRPQWQNNTSLPDKVVKYFKYRGIGQQTLLALQVSFATAYMPQKNGEVGTVQFPYIRNGEVVNVKYRTGDKHFKMEKDAELVFYNIDAIKGAKEVLIVEGEPDTLSFIEAGYKTVISVPNGASKGNQKLEYLDNCWQDFEGIEKIIIGTDSDEPGQKLAAELSRRLGVERCWTISYGEYKDGNEVLIKKGQAELLECLTSAKPYPIAGIFTAEMLMPELQDLYDKGLPKGSMIGQTQTDKHISFVPGQITTITGIPNHGKSDYLDHLMERLAIFHQWRFGIFSPENFPLALHLSKICEKLTGRSFDGRHTDAQNSPRMSQQEIEEAMQFINGSFFFMRPKDENFSLDNILELARLLVLKFGINGLVLDPWNTIEHQIPPGMNETIYISNQLAKIKSFAQIHGVHVFLVAHPTKIKKEKTSGRYEVPTLYDISGSANFFNKTDNGFCVYRNFDTKKTTVFFQKIKFKHLGQVGPVDYYYDMQNGRYNEAESQSDKRNHLHNQQEPIQLEIPEQIINGPDDEFPFDE